MSPVAVITVCTAPITYLLFTTGAWSASVLLPDTDISGAMAMAATTVVVPRTPGTPAAPLAVDRRCDTKLTNILGTCALKMVKLHVIG